jgi:cytochrome P450
MNTQTHAYPQNPIVAVTHSDPYPYYRDLLAKRPIYYDEELRLWVTASASTVTAALQSDLVRVRPPSEPIPKTLLNSYAAEIFQHLVRMNDGSRHDAMKQSITRVLSTADMIHFAQVSRQWAQILYAPAHLNDFAFHLPAYVIGTLLGVPENQLDQLAVWVKAFVGCLSPLNSTEQIEQGKVAAGNLIALFRGLLADDTINGWLAHLFAAADGVDGNRETIVIANGIGFLSQAFEATAGLIGNTIVCLARHPDLLRQLKADPALLAAVMQEVLRCDAPVQNTRRFVAEDGLIAGQTMKAGDAVLVVLAAANYDPAVNSDPERFDVLRKDRRIFTFGVGVHACPGLHLAASIAEVAVRQWIEHDPNPARVVERLAYQHSHNVRVPIFGG